MHRASISPSGPRDSGTPNPIAATTPYGKRRRRGRDLVLVRLYWILGPFQLEERSTAREETRDARVHARGETERGRWVLGWSVGCEPELIHIPLHCFLRYNCGLLVVIHGTNSISCPARSLEAASLPMLSRSARNLHLPYVTMSINEKKRRRK